MGLIGQPQFLLNSLLAGAERPVERTPPLNWSWNITQSYMWIRNFNAYLAVAVAGMPCRFVDPLTLYHHSSVELNLSWTFERNHHWMLMWWFYLQKAVFQLFQLTIHLHRDGFKPCMSGRLLFHCRAKLYQCGTVRPVLVPFAKCQEVHSVW